MSTVPSSRDITWDEYVAFGHGCEAVSSDQLVRVGDTLTYCSGDQVRLECPPMLLDVASVFS